MINTQHEIKNKDPIGSINRSINSKKINETCVLWQFILYLSNQISATFQHKYRFKSHVIQCRLRNVFKFTLQFIFEIRCVNK